MAIHSSTLAWKIPWTEEPDRLQSMGSQRVEKESKNKQTKKKSHSGTTYMSKSFNLKYLSKVKPVAYLVAQDSKIYTFTCQTFN